MTVMTSAPQITARENKVLQMPTELSLAVLVLYENDVETTTGGITEAQVKVDEVRKQIMTAEMRMNTFGNRINLLTSSHTDPVTHNTGFQGGLSDMTVLPETGDSPLPRNNWRWAIPRLSAEWRSSANGSGLTIAHRDHKLVQIQPRRVA